MHPELLSLGFIGGGTDSAVGTTHRIAAQMDSRWRIQAGCFSADPARNVNRETGAICKVDASRVYSTWREMLHAEAGRLDALAVLTPTPTHKEIVLAAIDRGFAVICEKALVESSADAREIRHAIRQNRGFLAVTYNYTGYPMLRELRRLIREGAMGRVTEVLIEMPQEGFIRRGRDGGVALPQRWRLEDRAIPTLSLDLGVHLHNIVGFLTSDSPVEVVAVHGTHGAFPQVVDNAAALVRYNSGFVCQMWYSKSAIGHRNGLRVRIYGERASAEWLQAEPETLRWNDVNGRQATYDRSSPEAIVASQTRYNRFKVGHPAGFIEAFANYYVDIANCLLEFKRTGEFSSPWVYGVDHAEEGLRLLEASVASARSKRWQSVADAEQSPPTRGS